MQFSIAILVGPGNDYVAGATHMSRKSEAVQGTGVFGTICRVPRLFSKLKGKVQIGMSKFILLFNTSIQYTFILAVLNLVRNRQCNGFNQIEEHS
ncbi:hypothetical protein E2542_SST03295 [Spatholobus suberectus]|nr:hypothetical protein E2542_SST03295 [Spatholobus suberectus]